MAMPLVTMSLPVNVFMTALVAKAFVLPKTTIGLISALPFVGNFLQIFFAPFLAKWKTPKTITVAAASFHLLSWAALGVLLPWIPRDDPASAGRWLITWFLITSCFGAIAGVSWNAWIQEWVPYRIRGKYFGRRNGTLQFSTLTFLLIAGWSLAQWNYGILVFQLLIAGAVVMRFFSLRWQWIFEFYHLLEDLLGPEHQTAVRAVRLDSVKQLCADRERALESREYRYGTALLWPVRAVRGVVDR